jgi:hypothetical protein
MADFMTGEERTETAKSVRQALVSAVNTGNTLTSIKNQLAAIRVVISTNADGIYDAGDLTKMDAKITTFKANVAALNTAVQNM